MSFSEHHSDETLDGKLRHRTIKNHMNYQTSAGIWLPTDAKIVSAKTATDSLEESASHYCLRSGLKAFFDRGSVLLRLSNRPDVWVRYTPLNIDLGSINTDSVNYFSAAWKNSILQWQIGPARCQKLITLSEPGHPASFSFKIEIATGMQFVLDNRILRFYDSRHNEVLSTFAPWGQDSRILSIGPKGATIDIDISMNENILTLTPNTEDLVKAIYPIIIDPTTTISTTNGIAGNSILEGDASSNLGGYSHGYICGTNNSWWVGKSTAWLVKINDSTLIPKGLIAAARFFSSKTGNIGVASGDVHNQPVYYYRIVDASTWVQGTGGWEYQAGSSSWNYRVSSTTHWAGGAAFSSADYVADASPPSISTANYAGMDVRHANLYPDWFMGWRDGRYVNNGFVSFTNDPQVCLDISNTPAASYLQPYFEIDYVIFGFGATGAMG